MERIKLLISLLFVKNTDSILKAFTKAQAQLSKYAQVQAEAAQAQTAQAQQLLQAARDKENEVRRAMAVAHNINKMCGGNDE